MFAGIGKMIGWTISWVAMLERLVNLGDFIYENGFSEVSIK